MRILTWNINSVRLRINLLGELLSTESPDVVCLQETKTPDEHFPLDAIRDFGYEHVAFHGMKGYNGVAILSKYPLDEIKTYDRCGKSDCRHISARFQPDANKAPITVHNLYIPAGGYEPDPVLNDKFQHKLDFVAELTEWFPANQNASDSIIALGDMNIAPLEQDVWSHKQMLNVVSHTPIELELFDKFFNSMNWVDAMRHFIPAEEKLFSWWSYRAKDWTKANRGRRLDHVWVTKPLEDSLKACSVLREARSWDRPSDHVPVIIDFAS